MRRYIHDCNPNTTIFRSRHRKLPANLFPDSNYTNVYNSFKISPQDFSNEIARRPSFTAFLGSRRHIFPRKKLRRQEFLVVATQRDICPKKRKVSLVFSKILGNTQDTFLVVKSPKCFLKIRKTVRTL